MSLVVGSSTNLNNKGKLTLPDMVKQHIFKTFHAREELQNLQVLNQISKTNEAFSIIHVQGSFEITKLIQIWNYNLF